MENERKMKNEMGKKLEIQENAVKSEEKKTYFMLIELSTITKGD